MEDNKDKIYTGPELITATSGNSGVMAAGCIVPVNPNNLEYTIYSEYTNPDHVFSIGLHTTRTDGPGLLYNLKT